MLAQVVVQWECVGLNENVDSEEPAGFRVDIRSSKVRGKVLGRLESAVEGRDGQSVVFNGTRLLLCHKCGGSDLNNTHV
jgi:hypothetical protein